MAIVRSTNVGGVVRESWDDTAGGTYRRYAADGTTVVETRTGGALTPLDVDIFAERAAFDAERTVTTTLITGGRAQFTALLGWIDAAKADEAQWAGFTNADMTAGVLRAAIGKLLTDRRRNLQMSTRLARLSLAKLDSADLRE